MKSKSIGAVLTLAAAVVATMAVEIRPAEAALGPCLINCDYNNICRSYVKTVGLLTCYINESPQSCSDCR